MVQQHQLLCFTSLPGIHQLLYTFATIDQQEAVKTSQFNLTILKCRQLLFENSHVLACPNLEGLFGIYVVAKEAFFKDGSLLQYFEKRNLKPGKPSYLHKYIYEECCYYTITAKLAPKWNMISNYLVCGRDFLTETNAMDTMHLTLNINEKGDTSFGFKISRIKLPSMTLDKLNLYKSKMTEYLSKNVLHFTKYESKSIRVLPSLKRAKILSISKTIDENSAIKTYQQMKRHWKNTYGYRLPESDAELFYLQVQFFEGSLVFTYPSICVRPYEPVFMQRVDSGPVVSVFMADLLKTVPTILGEKYKVPTHISEPSNELNNLSQKIPYPNASGVEIQALPKYRNNISATQNSVFAILPTQTQSPAKPSLPNEDQRSKLTQLISQLNKPQNRTTMYVTQPTSSTPCISETQPTQLNLDKSQKTDTIVKIVLDNNSEISEHKTENIFDNFEQNTEYNPSTKSTNSNTKSFKFIPVFAKQKVTQIHEVNNKKNNSAVSKELENQLDFLKNCVAQRQNSVSNSSTDKRAILPDNTKNGPKFVPKFSRKNITKLTDQKSKTPKLFMTSNNENTNMAVNQPNKKFESKFDLNLQNNANVSDHIAVKSNNNTNGNKSFKMEETPSNTNLKQPKFIMNQIKVISQSTQNKIDIPNLQLKRKNSKCESPGGKKMKSKPREINNMDEYIKNKTIHNLTVPILVNWLRENSVKCNEKEKKSDLIQKVLNFYQTNN